MNTPASFANLRPMQGMGTTTLLSLLAEQYRSREATAFASAARTATTTVTGLQNHNCRGILVFFNVSAASGTGGLELRLLVVDPTSGGNPRVNASITPLTTTGFRLYAFSPDLINLNGNFTQISNVVVPRSFELQVVHGDASSYTYSVGYCLLP